MVLNQIVLLVIVGMAVRDGILLFRHHRPFRLAFFLFWVMLGYAHVARREWMYPLIATTLLLALWLRRREPREVRRLLAEGAAARPSHPPHGASTLNPER